MMNNGWKNTFGSTHTAEECPPLTLEVLQEAYDKVRKIGYRTPKFFVHHLLDDAVVHGDMVDDFMEENVPGFDRETQKGFLIPKKIVPIIRKEFGPLSVVTIEF